MGVQGNGSVVSVGITEDGQNGVGGAVGDQSWIGWESWQLDGNLDDLTD